MIDITGVDLVKFAQKVYELSVPRGMGFLHYTSDPLSDKEAQEMVDAYKDNKRIALDMDYVKGRGCKMHVFRDGNKLSIQDSWYDHTDKELFDLLKSFGIDLDINKTINKHSVACDCYDCRKKERIM